MANALRGGAEAGAAARGHDFGGTHAREFVERERPGRRAGELGGAEFAGGEIERGDAYGPDIVFAGSGYAGEPLAFAGVECGVDCGARGEDTRDFAADDGLGGLGILHLLAEGDAVALSQKALEVGASRVVGNSAHGDGLGLVARGEGELKLARGDDGVLVKELVEVAEAEEEQSVGVRILGGAVLPHDWGEVALGGGFEGFGGETHALVSERSEYRTRSIGAFAFGRLAETFPAPYTYRMIEIPMTEAQFAAATQRLRTNGIELAGTTGTLNKDGVTAKYTYAAGKLVVEIVDRPSLLPLSLIEGKLQAYLEQSVAYDSSKSI